MLSVRKTTLTSCTGNSVCRSFSGFLGFPPAAFAIKKGLFEKRPYFFYIANFPRLCKKYDWGGTGCTIQKNIIHL